MIDNSLSPNSYAIDFGTSNTAIARWNLAMGKAELVRLPGMSQQFISANLNYSFRIPFGSPSKTG